MRRSNPITPARLGRSAEGLPFSEDFGAPYHPAAGALAQAEQVFLRGTDLPARWAGQARHVILETGFGLGHNFLATWAAWRRDPRRCERLVYLAIDKHPPVPADLADVHRDSPLADLAAQLIAAWPLATPDLHLLDFEGGRVQLMLALGDIHDVLPGLQAEAHSLYLDGFAPARNPAMWSADVFKRIARLAAPGAMAASGHADSAVRDGLARQGFEVRAAGADATVARYAPRFQPEPPRGWRWPHAAAREALVIGGGLAGCAAAQALALQGWRSTVIDRQAGPAQETSGNAGGLMHGIFNAPDSPHARWFRAAAMHTARNAAAGLAAGELAGTLAGFLRLDERLDATQADAQLSAVGLPRAWLAWLDVAGARAAAGLELPCGAWHYGAAGWLDPAGYSRWMLQSAGDSARWIGGTEVAALRGPRDGAADHHGGWQALDRHGRVIASAPVLVLANALDAARLLPAQCPPPGLSAVRGQVTRIPAGTPGLRPPRLTVAGQGYALRLDNGDVLVGATTQDEPVGIDGAALRLADQQRNLQRAAGLGVLDATAAELGTTLLPGRAGWRAVTADRLPLVGPPIDLAQLAQARGGRVRLDAHRHQPRCVDDRSGLYLCTGLGSRGITSAALAGRLLAAWVGGAPAPVDADLRNALDPARLSK